MKGISHVMNEPVPEEWTELLQDMISPRLKTNYNFTTRQLELLHNYQLKREGQSATVLDKKRLCLDAGLSLDQVNQRLQSQLTGVGLVSFNQTSFADGINGILEADGANIRQNQQALQNNNYLPQIFGEFGHDLQFEPFTFQ